MPLIQRSHTSLRPFAFGRLFVLATTAKPPQPLGFARRRRNEILKHLGGQQRPRHGPLRPNLVGRLFGRLDLLLAVPKPVDQQIAPIVVIHHHLAGRAAGRLPGLFIRLQIQRRQLLVVPVQLDGRAVTDGGIVADRHVVAANQDGLKGDCLFLVFATTPGARRHGGLRVDFTQIELGQRLPLGVAHGNFHVDALENASEWSVSSSFVFWRNRMATLVAASSGTAVVSSSSFFVLLLLFVVTSTAVPTSSSRRWCTARCASEEESAGWWCHYYRHRRRP